MAELDLARAMPTPPLVSSLEASWEGIDVEHNRQPCFETPEHSLSRHLVAVHIGAPIRVEKGVDGRFVRQRAVWGDISVLPAGLPNWERWEGTAEYVALRLDPALVARIAGRSPTRGGAQIAPRSKTRDPLVLHMALALLSEVREGSADHLYAESMAAVLAAHLLKRHSTSRRLPRDFAYGLSRSELRTVTELVRERLASGPSVEEMAGAVGMSYHHFSRLFRRSTGLSPYQYVIQKRVEKAQELLLGTSLPAGEIARLSGFAHQGHLARHFGRLVGVSPGTFRREGLG
jgi:AraC family transcriptional regulator